MGRRSDWEEYDCPFVPCSASWWMVPGNGFRVPGHTPQGDAAAPWVGTANEGENCPGSYVFIGEVSREPLDAADRDKLIAGFDKWSAAKHYREQAEQVTDEDQARRNLDMPTDPDSRFLGFPLGKREHGIDPTAFPARRGDPGAPDKDWKPEPKILPMTQIGQPLGRAAMDNAHATTKQLLALTEGKMDEALGALGRIPDVADILDGIVTMVAVHVDAAAALAQATVGSGEGAPASAGEMVSHIQRAQAKASVESGGDLVAALTKFAYETTQIIQFIGAAQESAREYHRTLGGN